MDGDDEAWLDGARPVGRFADAAPMERCFVWALRLWLDGVAGQQEVWSHFASRLGSRAAYAVTLRFESHLLAIAHGHRRGLCRHRAACVCIGRDEATLARVVALAGAGDLDAASAAAAPLMRGDCLSEVVETAASLGRLLMGVDGGPTASAMARPRAFGSGRTLH